MLTKLKRGQKKCVKCCAINGPRAYECKSCGQQFEMKKRRRTPRRSQVLDWRSLKSGDKIRVIGGTGPYYVGADGIRTYFTERGIYTVRGVDKNGIHAYDGTGYCFLYMGLCQKSTLIDNIIKEPHKILQIKG